jgi:hypothetical protein
VDVVLPAIFDMWDTEDDRTVVIMCCNELAEAMNRCGPALVADRTSYLPISLFPPIIVLSYTLLTFVAP